MPFYLVAWAVIGLGMGAGLYDAAFGTLGRYYGQEARSAITALTLWGGFASTVCWPLSAYLVEALGWRGTCFAYAALQLGLALPAHVLLLPRVQEPITAAAPAPIASPAGASVVNEQHAFVLLVGVAVVSGALSTIVSVHLLTLLQARDVALGAAVALGALVGPSQVGARVVEMLFGQRYHPIWTMIAAVTLIALGVLLLALGFPILAFALVLYGAGNGIYSIARGTLPLALFGPGRYPVLMGRLGRPALLASSLAPSAGALLLEHGGATWTLMVLACLAALNVALGLTLWVACMVGREPVP
jgi:MFS family permease